MAQSETAIAREWIIGLRPATWFWSRDIPVRAEIARPVLSRLCGDLSVNVQRHARGLYWRGYPEGHQFHTFRPCYDIGALMLGGSGSGLWGWSALNRLGWTLQCPVKQNITVLGRPPKPIAPSIEYYTSSNDRRASLNWTEVTVLEALTWFKYTEEPWHECLEHLLNGQSAIKLGWDLPVRSSMLRWAAETERDMTVEIEYKIDEIAAALPDESSTAADHADTARSAIPGLATSAACSPGRRETVARPPVGYADSILFRSGSESQEALRDGYTRIRPLIWGDVAPFDDAIELAASLDGR